MPVASTQATSPSTVICARVPTASSRAAGVGGVGRGFVLRSQEGMGWRAFVRRVERNRAGKTSTQEVLVEWENEMRIAIKTLEYGPRAHAASVWRARVTGMVPAHD